MSLGRSELDVSNSGRGRRIRKPSDKALAAAQANLADSSSDEASDAEGRPATRQVTSRNKARKRRAESASSGADIDSDERRSADSPATRTTAHRVSPAAEKLSAIGVQGFADAAPLREAKSGTAERAGSSSSALFGAEALMGLAALASSSLTSASPSPVPPPPAPPPPAAVASVASSRNRPPAAAKAAPPPPPPRNKPRKETWTAATSPVRPQKAAPAAPMQSRMVLPKGAPPQQPEQRTWKRCATHVAIAYYIFYRQRQQLLQHLAVTNPPLAQKMAPYAMDPTYDARLLKERSMEAAKRKLMPPPPPLQYMLNAPPGKDAQNFAPYPGFHGGGLTPQMQAQFAQQLQSQLAMLHQAPSAGFASASPSPFAAGAMAYFGPPPTSGPPPPQPSVPSQPQQPQQPQQQTSAAWNGSVPAQSSATTASGAEVIPSLPPILEKNLPASLKEEPAAPPPSLPAKAAPVDGAAS